MALSEKPRANLAASKTFERQHFRNKSLVGHLSYLTTRLGVDEEEPRERVSGLDNLHAVGSRAKFW